MFSILKTFKGKTKSGKESMFKVGTVRNDLADDLAKEMLAKKWIVAIGEEPKTKKDK